MQRNGKLFKKGMISLLSIAIAFSAFSIGFSSWALTGDKEDANLTFIGDAAKIEGVTFKDLSIGPDKVTYDSKKDDNEGRVQYKEGKSKGESLSFVATGIVSKCEYVGSVDFSLKIKNSTQKATYDDLVRKGYVREPNFQSLSIYDETTSGTIDETTVGYYWTTNIINDIRNFKVVDTFLWGAKFNYKNPGEFFDSNDISLTDNKKGNDYSYSEICDILDNLYELNDIQYTIVATAKPKKYDITYDLDGGLSGPNDSKDILFTEKYTIPTAKPSKVGYDFVGYSNKKDGTVLYNVGQTFNIKDMASGSSKEIILYAIWAAKSIKITYSDGNGKTYVDNATYDKEYTFKTPSEIGFDLTGDVSWIIGNKTYSPGETLIINETNITNSSSGSVSLTGKVIEKVKVTYQYPEGNYEDKTFSVIKGEDYTILRYGELDWTISDGYVFIGWSFNGNTYSGGQIISNISTDMTFKLEYIGKEVKVVFNSNGGLIDGKDQYITSDYYGSSLSTFPESNKVIKDNATFIGWNTSTDENGKSVDSSTILNDELINGLSTMEKPTINLYAIFVDDITIILDFDSNQLSLSSGAKKQTLKYVETFTLPTMTSRYGYSFSGWYYNSKYDGNPISSSNIAFSELINYKNEKDGIVYLYAKANKKIEYTVNISIEGSGTITIQNNSNNNSSQEFPKSGSAEYYDSTKLTITAKAGEDYSIKTFTVTGSDATKNGDSYVINNLKEEGVTVKLVTESSCILPTTKVMLSDGTYKLAGELTTKDNVLSFNHETGKFESTMIAGNDHINSKVEEHIVLYLRFSNNDEIGVVYNHGFFSVNENKYVYLSFENYQNYIGQEFKSITFKNGEYIFENVELISGTVKKEYTSICSPITYKNLDIVTESMLSIAGGFDGMFNYFDYDENLKFDIERMNNDIALYGLYKYDDFKDKIPYEVFDGFNFKYLKVSIGKGLLTEELLDYYIKRYVPIFEEQN